MNENPVNQSPNSTEPIKATSSAESIQDKVKIATKDAFSAFKMFALNPVGDLSNTFEALGNKRSLKVGFIFGVTFAIICTFLFGRLIPMSIDVSTYIKVFFAGLVPFAGLIGANFISRLVFKGQGSLSHDFFISGATILPIAALGIVSTILGLGNFEVIALLTIVAFCTSILMIHAGQIKIYKITEKLATIAVPLVLVVSTWISKIVIFSFAKELFKF